MFELFKCLKSSVAWNLHSFYLAVRSFHFFNLFTVTFFSKAGRVSSGDDGRRIRCSGMLLWCDVGLFSLPHDLPSAQNGLQHISMSDLFVFDPEDRRECCRSTEIEYSCCSWTLTSMWGAKCTHTCTITILSGSTRFKAFVFIDGFALAPPPTVFHLTVGFNFLLSHSQDLGLYLSMFNSTRGRIPGCIHFSTVIILKNAEDGVFWCSSWLKDRLTLLCLWQLRSNCYFSHIFP